MKRLNGFLKILADSALIAIGMLAAACAAPTAFKIPFDRSIMILGCVLGAILLSAWMHLPRIGIIPGLIFLAGTVLFAWFRREELDFAFRAVLHILLEPLSQDYPSLPTVAMPTVPHGVASLYTRDAVTTFLLIVAAVVGMLLAFSLVRGRNALLAVLIPLPTFLLSLVYTDQPPALWTVILLSIYAGGALLGTRLRKSESPRLGLFLTAVLPLLLALAMLVLVISPQSRFTPIPFEQRKEMLGDRAEELGDLMLSAVRRNPRRYKLNDQDDRDDDDTRVFQLNASKAGTYLLRSHSYGQYKSGVWQEAPEYHGEWSPLEALGKSSYGEYTHLKIRSSISSERYVPYAFRLWEPIRMRESTVPSSSHTSYEWMILPSVDLVAGNVSQQEREYAAFAKEQYTLPNGDDKAMLLRLVKKAGLVTRSDVYRTACEVAAYVRGAATYTLQPEKAPKGSDFIEYFLTESREGYCVHFASATTALLQAMGIPARYTIGYRADIPTPEMWIDVTENTAHAWTEVYLTGIGWLPIESTAGFSYELLNIRDPNAQAVAQSATPKPTPTPTPTPTPEQTTETKDPNATPIPSDELIALPNESTEPTQRPSVIGGGTVITESGRASGAWWLLLLVPVLPAVWIVCGMMIRKRRDSRFRQKNGRQAVLCMLQYLKTLERYGIAPDPHAQEWEDEAMYSNHPMTETRKDLLHTIRLEQNKLFWDEPLKRFFIKWILFRI